MQENQTKDNDLKRILAEINMPENEDEKSTNENNLENEEIETIHLYIYREDPKGNNNVVDADTPKDKTHPFGLIIACFIASLLPIFSIAFQIFLILNPPTVTITLVPIQKELGLRAEILAVSNPGPNEILSHLLAPITISESKTTPATGRGHQNAQIARGTITFYNGSFTSQNVPRGTQLTGKDGANVVTDNAVIIPPATSSTPPTFGTVSVSAHAIFTGPMGNISARDINSYSLGASILAQNTAPFTGGMDARDFSIVTQTDIDNALNPLKTQVTQSVQTQLEREVITGQSLIPPLCSTNIFLDHKQGEEASKVKMTYSESCKAMAYDTASLQKVGLEILMGLAEKQLGANYFPHLGIRICILNIPMKDFL
jgi:hypothetical protein